MTVLTQRTRRWITPAVMLIGGTALTVASAAGGGSGSNAGAVLISGLVLTLVLTAGFVAIGRTRTDFGALAAGAADERQRALDLRATAATGIVMIVVLLVGSVVTLAQGHDGQPWVDLAAGSGVVYLGFLAFFRRF